MSENVLIFEDDNGESIYVELPEADDELKGYRGEEQEKLVQKAQVTFQKALSPIKHVANKTLATLNEIAEAPEEVTLKMGLKFTGEANAVLTKIGGEATLEVSIKWTRASLQQSPTV